MALGRKLPCTCPRRSRIHHRLALWVCAVCVAWTHRPLGSAAPTGALAFAHSKQLLSGSDWRIGRTSARAESLSDVFQRLVGMDVKPAENATAGEDSGMDRGGDWGIFRRKSRSRNGYRGGGQVTARSYEDLDKGQEVNGRVYKVFNSAVGSSYALIDIGCDEPAVLLGQKSEMSKLYPGDMLEQLVIKDMDEERQRVVLSQGASIEDLIKGSLEEQRSTTRSVPERWSVNLTFPASRNFADGIDVDLKGLKLKSVDLPGGKFSVNVLGRTSSGSTADVKPPSMSIERTRAYKGTYRDASKGFEIVFDGWRITEVNKRRGRILLEPVLPPPEKQLELKEGDLVNATVERINEGGVWASLGNAWQQWSVKLMVPVKYISRVKWGEEFESLQVDKLDKGSRRMSVIAQDWDARLGQRPEYRNQTKDLIEGSAVTGFRLTTKPVLLKQQGGMVKVDIGCEVPAIMRQREAAAALPRGSAERPMDLVVKRVNATTGEVTVGLRKRR